MFVKFDRKNKFFFNEISKETRNKIISSKMEKNIIIWSKINIIKVWFLLPFSGSDWLGGLLIWFEIWSELRASDSEKSVSVSKMGEGKKYNN